MNFQGNILSALGTLSQLAVFKNLTGNVKRNTENIQTAGERIGETNVRINKADERIDEAEDRVDKDMIKSGKLLSAPNDEYRKEYRNNRQLVYQLGGAKSQLRDLRSEYDKFQYYHRNDESALSRKREAYYTKALEEARKKVSSIRDKLLSSKERLMKYEEGDKEDGTNK